MIIGLSEDEKYNVIRPLFGAREFDASTNFPIIKRQNLSIEMLEEINAINFQNLSSRRDNKNNLVLMFTYDKILDRLWNAPLKRVPIFQSCAAIATPDFSIYPTMNENDIRYNIYKNRWLGCTWQDYDCVVIPTIGWAKPDTYDLCFSGVECKSDLIISTIGCQNYKEDFLKGFFEMKRRLSPRIIIVYGKMIEGMTGTFINFQYVDSFSKKFQQLRIPQISRIFEIKEVA